MRSPEPTLVEGLGLCYFLQLESEVHYDSLVVWVTARPFDAV
jgi:hypothetical protein